MNLSVADPHWGWWIVFYFFLGGIAAGAYFISSLMALAGTDDDRQLSRAGYWIALPLLAICGVLLIVDLDRPERFWHMLLRSEVVHEALRAGWPWSAESWSIMARAPLLKWWSPMSIGAWALLLFSFFSMLSFLGTLRPATSLARRLRQGTRGKIVLNLVRWSVQAPGCALGFFVAAYTGALLTATNQPIWSDSVWIAALFLTSAASTGIAAMIVLGRFLQIAPAESLDRLERADLWALGLELVVFAVFLASLGTFLVAVLSTWSGILLVVGTLVIGLLLPLAIHLRLGMSGRRWAVTAAACALVGGLVLRYAILATPPELLHRGHDVQARFSPEDGRVPGSGPGGDGGNRATRE